MLKSSSARGAAALLAISALAAGGCSADDAGVVEGPVTVYVSLPLSGPAAADGNDAADGARLALEEAGGRAGDLEVEARYLDDAGEGVLWDPVAVGENARRAASDTTTAAYIGELASEPTRASAPITNEAGIAQMSPGATAVDLTRPAEGYSDSPDRYRPSGEATFARNVPTDDVVIEAIATAAVDGGAATVSAAFPDDAFGRLSGQELDLAAEQVGLEVPAEGDGDVVVGDEGAGFVMVRGGAEGGTTYFDPPLAPSSLPGADFVPAFTGEFGRDPGPYAAYGYDAMQAVLAAIEDAQGSSEFRGDIVDALIGSEHPDSVLGEYSIDDDGDTSLCDVQPYERSREGRPLAPVCAD